jgi:ADP-ribosyl-[dinitrogen reductase] hydrolase
VRLDRARGALLGLAVGDALGATNEFEVLDAPPFPTLASGPVTDIVGGGPCGVAPGQVTDDTQMACCLFGSICESGRLDVTDVASRYTSWKAKAFDIGNQTASALGLMEKGLGPLSAGKAVWESARGTKPAGNGSLMRTAPIAVLLGGDPVAVREASLAESAITHFDPRCQIACAALNAAIRAAIFEAADAALMHRAADAAVEALRDAALGCDAALVTAAADALKEDLRLSSHIDPDLYGEVHLHAHQGFVRVAFRLAFWELLHAPSFTAALIDVVNRGGDTDTNGAICGALCGGLFGEAAIPAQWRSSVLGAPALAGEMTYHPIAFLELARCA